MPRLKVLIVDDNADIADSLSLLVQFEGHQSFVAYDAFSGLRLAEKELPDLIIHDIALPAMSGYDAAHHLRSNPMLNKTVLVAHSGHCGEHDKQRAIEAGFDEHVDKPMDPVFLVRMLKMLAMATRTAGGPAAEKFLGGALHQLVAHSSR